MKSAIPDKNILSIYKNIVKKKGGVSTPGAVRPLGIPCRVICSFMTPAQRFAARAFQAPIAEALV
jgi:hypothetical protein